MIKNYLKIAWRTITQNKINSLINIVGLAIGMACVIFILLYVQDELKYDRFLNKVDHIYQLNVNANFEGSEFLTGNTPPPVGPALEKEFPEIEASVRIYQPGDALVRYKSDKQSENYFTEHAVWAVDSNFFQVFSKCPGEESNPFCNIAQAIRTVINCIHGSHICK